MLNSNGWDFIWCQRKETIIINLRSDNNSKKNILHISLQHLQVNTIVFNVNSSMFRNLKIEMEHQN